MKRNQEYILTIYEEGSFSKAADRLFVSQPALSIIVKKTEEELGLPLFNRATKPIKLTSAGAYYVDYIKEVRAAEDKLQQRLNSLREQEKGNLVIGTSNFFSSYAFLEIFAEFKQKHPNYAITLTEGNNPYLAQLLQNSEVELVVSVGPLDAKLFNIIPWRQEHLILGVPADDPINQELKTCALTFDDVKNEKYLSPDVPPITLSLFAEKNFILLKRGNDGYTRGLSLCHNAGFKPHVKMYLDQMTTTYSSVKNGYGCAFIRADIVKYKEHTDKLCFYKIDDPLAVRTIYIYYKKTGELSKTAQQFINFLQQNYSNIQTKG